MRLPSFHVEEYETVAIVGRSGTGKTTLLNIVSGCISSDRGSVVVQGTNIVDLAERTLREFRICNIGMVFQEFELLEHLTVLDNILLPYRITPHLQYGLAVCERAVSLANEVGLKDKLRRNVRQLSQGERQRVAVCRALLPEPSLLLCDEPTGNLDPENSRHVIDIIFKYAKDHGGTVISVTHDLALARCFDRMVDIADIADIADIGGNVA